MSDLISEIKGLQGSIKESHKSLFSALEDQSAEIKRVGGTAAHTATRIETLETKLEAKEREMQEMKAAFEARLSDVETKNNRLGGTATGSEESLAQVFIKSDAYKNFMKMRGSQNSESVSCYSTLKANFRNMQRKDLAGEATLRSVLNTNRLETIYHDPVRPNRMRDLFTVIPTKESQIEFIVEDLFLNAAATVAEGNAAAESSWDFSDKTLPTRMIAHYTPVNRQILADINTLETYINLRMNQGLKLREDAQILYGSGQNQDLTGLLVTDGIQTSTWSGGVVGDTKIDAVRRAITKLQLAFYPATAMVLHPNDWQDIELTKASTGLYVWVNVGSGAEPVLWRVPVVTNTALQPGDAVLGDFHSSAMIWDREEANIRVTDSHLDYFIKNRMVLLCEERLCLTVMRPKSIMYLQFDAAPHS